LIFWIFIKNFPQKKTIIDSNKIVLTLLHRAEVEKNKGSSRVKSDLDPIKILLTAIGALIID